ncbi:hypothetical protein [Salinicoccus kekensis]|uniref:Competence protein ComGF n=1 Tax=Salinicoccus kekensis TaxID=714307 RepID=A0A285U9W8_9STAP|nr:hypothetical protein [Salinicoccus kekensis]SOC38704.1 competence protein ComGF [Salinicoccus kekensis]
MVNRKKNYASVIRNEGFSYIEVLFSLSIISMIAFILPGVFGVFSQLKMVDVNLDGDILVMDIIEASRDAEEIVTNGRDTIAFETERGLEEYRYRDSRIIKSIDGKGFITMLFDVVEWKISNDEGAVSLKIKTNGEFDETIIIRK